MLICYDLVALLLDGKTFAADAMVIALGITLSGEKVLLGFVQTAYERPRYAEATAALLRLRAQLRLLNASAATSLATTNCLDSIPARAPPGDHPRHPPRQAPPLRPRVASRPPRNFSRLDFRRSNFFP